MQCGMHGVGVMLRESSELTAPRNEGNDGVSEPGNEFPHFPVLAEGLGEGVICHIRREELHRLPVISRGRKMGKQAGTGQTQVFVWSLAGISIYFPTKMMMSPFPSPPPAPTKPAWVMQAMDLQEEGFVPRCSHF